eukprot:TRINITY_DN70832_c0_g1_i1.p1 TRINITY_DN70832_c0_g1~~TRINITY_DN70832_c0_g1_i1.p1  ORF type:complete len:514 (-),score=83.38 TRINITY_DN70832_c0_g1_i1:66-1607(-)
MRIQAGQLPGKPRLAATLLATCLGIAALWIHDAALLVLPGHQRSPKRSGLLLWDGHRSHRAVRVAAVAADTLLDSVAVVCSERELRVKVSEAKGQLRRLRIAKRPENEQEAAREALDGLLERARRLEELKAAIGKLRRQAAASEESGSDALDDLLGAYKEMTGEDYSRRGSRGTRHRSPRTMEEAAAPAASTFGPRPETPFRFEVLHESKKPGSRARVGRIHTAHGVIETPAFVPVGTNAALKAVDAEQAAAAGTSLLFCNTYHLLVHPGADIVEGAGGLHNFMRHEGPIITDSGGFQVFSLGSQGEGEGDGPELKSRSRDRQSWNDTATRDGNTGLLQSVSEEGATFRSYLDGRVLQLTPESSVAAQKAFGSDIIVPLDHLPPLRLTREKLLESVELSHRWEARSLRAHQADPRGQAMYGVLHGGTDRELRKASADYISSLPFDGLAVGGSLGADRQEMIELLQWLMPQLPRDRPVHLLGIGDETSCRAAVSLGLDTMDSCNPIGLSMPGSG